MTEARTRRGSKRKRDDEDRPDAAKKRHSGYIMCLWSDHDPTGQLLFAPAWDPQQFVDDCNAQWRAYKQRKQPSSALFQLMDKGAVHATPHEKHVGLDEDQDVAMQELTETAEQWMTVYTLPQSKRTHTKSKPSSQCRDDECKKQAVYGVEYKKPLHCGQHRGPGEINVTTKWCEWPGCTKMPVFGCIWKQPKHCKSHRQPGEANVRDKRCEEPDCKKRPNFGTEWRKPKHCDLHRKPGEEDVTHNRCAKRGCKKRPNFGTERGKPRHCDVHRQPGEEDVTHKRCLEPTCKKRANLGTKWGRPKHCDLHRQPGEQDVVTRRCEEPGCDTIPTFGLKCDKPRHCDKHRQSGEEDFRHKRCEESGCETRATFGREWGTAKHCEKHRRAGEQDVCNKHCERNGCLTIALKDGFCTIHHPEYIAGIHGASKAACEFMDNLQKQLRLPSIRHKHYCNVSKQVTGDEFVLPGTRWRADGYVPPSSSVPPNLPFAVGANGLVIEFHGHEWHGWPDGKHADETNCKGFRYGDLYEATMDRMQAIKDLGYTVVYIWESDFAAWKKQVVKSLFQYCHVL